MDADEEFLPPITNMTLMGDSNNTMTDIDSTLDGTVYAYDGNLTIPFCSANFSYLNVTCEPTFEFSLILLGMQTH